MYLKVFPSCVSFSQICDGVLAIVMKAVYVNECMLCGISLIIA